MAIHAERRTIARGSHPSTSSAWRQAAAGRKPHGTRAEIKELTRSIYVIKSEFPERSACWIRQTLRSHPAPQKAPGLKLAYSDGEADRHGDLPPGSAQAIVASNLFR
jgi:hypothetical protein